MHKLIKLDQAWPYMLIIPILQRHSRRSATCLGYTANARTTSATEQDSVSKSIH